MRLQPQGWARPYVSLLLLLLLRWTLPTCMFVCIHMYSLMVRE